MEIFAKLAFFVWKTDTRSGYKDVNTVLSLDGGIDMEMKSIKNFCKNLKLKKLKLKILCATTQVENYSSKRCKCDNRRLQNQYAGSVHNKYVMFIRYHRQNEACGRTRAQNLLCG